jgi:nitrite reductase/ring-hydroxylating ferredoxin subunit
MLNKFLKFLFPEKFYVFDDLESAKASVPIGKGVRVRAGNEEVCITRNEVRFFAFLNKCPHRQLPLHQGIIEKDGWICPFHRYCFNLSSGKNTTVPHPGKLIIYKTGVDRKGFYIVIK